MTQYDNNGKPHPDVGTGAASSWDRATNTYAGCSCQPWRYSPMHPRPSSPDCKEHGFLVQKHTPPYLVGLVGCSSKKLDHAAPARDLYTSQLFRKASAYAEATCDRWYILSAKHGLLHPDEIIEPYDMQLNASDNTWAARVRKELSVELAAVRGATLVTLAGVRYQTMLRPYRWAYQIPMKGMGIGQQLGFLTTELGKLNQDRAA